MAQCPVFSFIIPAYNEEAAIVESVARITAFAASLSDPAEVIFVNDGSRDNTLPILLSLLPQNPSMRVVNLSRNFGHQNAITAGMKHAQGQAVIIMDADLQDPPEVVVNMIAKWREGYDIVYGVRRERDGETAFKKFTAALFYRFLSSITSVDVPRNVGDFRLVGRRALDVFLSLPERDRYVRGMFSWVGFKQTGVEFHRQARVAGTTKYSLRRMLRLASNGIVGFSDMPLRAILMLGFMIGGLSFLGALYAIIMYFVDGSAVRGWTSLIVAQGILWSMNFIVLGILGLYVGRIHEEVKGRPLYIVEGVYPKPDKDV